MGYGSVNVPGVSGPELEAVRALANSALEKANEALEGGGGSGCVLKITFDADFAGQQYTVTDGAETPRLAPCRRALWIPSVSRTATRSTPSAQAPRLASSIPRP